MRNLSVWQALIVASQLGFVLAAGVTVGLFAGWYLDSITHTSPLFIMLGALLGMIAGLYGCAQMVRDVLGKGRSS